MMTSRIGGRRKWRRRLRCKVASRGSLATLVDLEVKVVRLLLLLRPLLSLRSKNASMSVNLNVNTSANRNPSMSVNTSASLNGTSSLNRHHHMHDRL